MYETGEQSKEATLILALELGESIASDIGLTRPKEDYPLTLDEILEEKRKMSEQVYPLIESVWQERDVTFVVVCGRDVFKSFDPIQDFDPHAFDDLVSTKFLTLHRPATVTSPTLATR